MHDKFMLVNSIVANNDVHNFKISESFAYDELVSVFPYDKPAVIISVNKKAIVSNTINQRLSLPILMHRTNI